MYNYPEAYEAKEKLADQIKSAEQHCHECNKWFSVDLNKLKEGWKVKADAKGFSPMTMTNCTHCGKSNILLTPGKYDRPFAVKNLCSVQYYTR